MLNSEKTKKKSDKLYLIFTDLDGTLLDSRYRFKEALPVLRKLKQKQIPVIFCSAKTIGEQKIFQNKMGLRHPLIAEDGSAVYIPKGYFKKRKGELSGNYDVITLGIEYKKIKKELKRLSRRHYIKGYFNMSQKEIAKEMGLDLKGAKLAKKRQYSETLLDADKKALQKLKKRFNVVCGGKGIHVFGKKSHKGKAVKILTNLYKKNASVVSIGIGNSYTDEAMLKYVDIPVLVKNPDRRWARIKIKSLYKARGIGPKGWAEAVKKFVLGE
ncbi:HAD-IIB family hydrolase [Candidatus Woesearchaeota archaeon]|nr:HAD-IIB family hydrolase [Candidatus Woesearchaeota archaeon]